MLRGSFVNSGILRNAIRKKIYADDFTQHLLVAYKVSDDSLPCPRFACPLQLCLNSLHQSFSHAFLILGKYTDKEKELEPCNTQVLAWNWPFLLWSPGNIFTNHNCPMHGFPPEVKMTVEHQRQFIRGYFWSCGTSLLQAIDGFSGISFFFSCDEQNNSLQHHVEWVFQSSTAWCVSRFAHGPSLLLGKAKRSSQERLRVSTVWGRVTLVLIFGHSRAFPTYTPWGTVPLLSSCPKRGDIKTPI